MELEENAGAPQAEEKQSNGQLQVDLSDDRDDDRDDAGPAPVGDQESKKGRRAQFRELRDVAKRSEERAAQMERQLAELRGQLQAYQSQRNAPAPQQQEDSDPLTGQIEGKWAQQQAILNQLRDPNRQLSDTEADKLSREWRKLDRERRKLELKQDAREIMPSAEAPSQRDYENAILASEFPRVFADDVVKEEARVEMMKLVRQGKPVNLITAREAARRVEVRNFGKAPAAPSDADRARHTSVPSQPGVTATRQSFTPTSFQLRSARAFTQHLEGLPDEERVRIWANKVGKKHGLI